MLTQCPNCQTTFRITSEILRAADGQVRCGRCEMQFDALDRLIEENEPGDGESGRFLRPPRASAAPSQIEVEEPEMQEDITLEGRRIEISGTYRVLDEDASGQPQIRQEITEEWVEIEGLEQEPEEEESKSEEEAAEAPEATAYADGEDQADDEQDSMPRAARFEPAQPRIEPAASPDLDLLAPSRRASSPAWRWLAAPLALLLVAQAVHHYRAALARHPRIGAPLAGLYAALGLKLTPHWDLHAYEIRQWGVVSDPTKPGTLKVRASITNLADFAQPYPLLKLMLEDRWGEQVRAREFEPAEYLDPGLSPQRLLAPAQKASAVVDIVDPGPDAEGFRFDVCLRGAKGVVCAEETPAAR